MPHFLFKGMLRVTFIIMASFLSKLFSRGQSKNENKKYIFPTENFSVVQGQVNGKPMIGSLNMGYKNYEKKLNIPGA